MTKPKSRENVLTPEERERLLSLTKSDEEELALKGLLFTGMRISEFIHMRKDWIDFREGIINIPIKMRCGCYECVSKVGLCKYCKKKRPCGYWHPKTSHGQRPVPILPEVDALFRNYFKNYSAIMDLLDNRVNAWRLVKNVGKRARTRHKVFPHSIRATFATILCEKGLNNPVTLKDIMGWKKLDMATSYIKLSGVGMKKEIERIWLEK